MNEGDAFLESLRQYQQQDYALRKQQMLAEKKAALYQNAFSALANIGGLYGGGAWPVGSTPPGYAHSYEDPSADDYDPLRVVRERMERKGSR